MTQGPLRTTISDGQRYVDEPVFLDVAAKPLALAVHHSFRPVPGLPRLHPRVRILTHYNRVPLRWMAPDSNGVLAPRR